MAIVIGKPGRFFSAEQAAEHIAGYLVFNDITARDIQRREMQSGVFSYCKAIETFCPIGPCVVTADEVGDPHDLAMWLDLNGERMQTGHTKTMIFGVAKLVSYISQFTTLWPGDLITTGTPPGVGMGKKPQPIFLKPGDVMTLGIEKLGEQRQRVVAWS